MTTLEKDGCGDILIPLTMRAAICTEAGAPCVVERIPVPTPTGRDLLVKVKAASLCQTDLTIMSGKVGTDWFPLVPGHEAVSVVVQVSEEAAPWGFQVGDLVGAPLWCEFCLECHSCKNNRFQYCAQTKAKGVHKAGFFSEYTTLDPASTVLISRNFGVTTPLQGLDKRLSPIFCAGITVWDGLELSKLGVSESVGVVGAGGLGQLAIAFLTILGHKVVVMDVQDKQLVACKEEYPGVETINSGNCSDLAARLREVNNGNLLNTAFVTSGAKAAYDSTLPLLEPYGKLVVIGHPPKPLEISAYMMSDRRISIIGATVSNPASAAKCVEFCRRLSVYPRVNPREFQLEDLNEMITMMNSGKVEEGRMVVYFN